MPQPLPTSHLESLRRSGITRPHIHVTDGLHARFVPLVRARFLWLFVGLLGGVGAASIAGVFEEALRKEIILAFFIPVVVYMSDAVGTQTEALFIRSAALGPIRFARSFFREVCVGAVLGALFGCAAFLLVTVLWGKPVVALVLALTLAVTMTMATALAITIPWLLIRLGRDPAIGSGPFATIIQDVLSLTAYFLIANALL